MFMELFYFIAIIVFIVLSVGVLWYLESISNSFNSIVSELNKIQSEVAKSNKNLSKKRASL